MMKRWIDPNYIRFINRILYIFKSKEMKVTKNTPVGTRMKVVSNTSGHGMAVGSFVTLNRYNKVGSSGACGRDTVSVNESGSYFYTEDLELISVTAEDIQKEIDDANFVVANLKLKLEYLKKSGSKEYDENEFKAYSTLVALENKEMSTFEKARQIASLFR